MVESILVSKKSAKAEEMVNRMNTSPIFDCTVFVQMHVLEGVIIVYISDGYTLKASLII